MGRTKGGKGMRHPNHPEPPPPRRIYEDVKPTLPAIIGLAIVTVAVIWGLILLLPAPITICGC